MNHYKARFLPALMALIIGSIGLLATESGMAEGKCDLLDGDRETMLRAEVAALGTTSSPECGVAHILIDIICAMDEWSSDECLEAIDWFNANCYQFTSLPGTGEYPSGEPCSSCHGTFMD